MKRIISILALVFGCSMMPLAAFSAEERNLETVTLWPLFDYRTDEGDGKSSLSLLGPIIELRSTPDDRSVSVRPLYHATTLKSDGSTRADYLYPIASSKDDAEAFSFSVVRGIVQWDFEKGESKDSAGGMFFPFFISGKSEKYGPYVSVFPLYGDIYERFWRDEYHYVMFPLYARTVKKGTTTTNILYPFFSVTQGEKESGFQVWPLYGQGEKEGVYQKRFFLWPFFMSEDTGLDTENPVSRRYVMPLYVSQEGPQISSRHVMWPFFGYIDNKATKTRETDIFWPFMVRIRGEKRHGDYFLPLFANDRGENWSKKWILWPGYREDRIESDRFVQEKTRLLLFLYRDNSESWPKEGVSRRKTAFWPLFSYVRSEGNEKRLTLPALAETIFDSPGVEENWAPFWRLYRQEWNDKGDSSVSFLWNLFWYDRRDGATSHELFPLWRYAGTSTGSDVSFFKGLLRYRSDGKGSSLGLFWIPGIFNWGGETKPSLKGAEQ